jgi:hypothetical protein
MPAAAANGAPEPENDDVDEPAETAQPQWAFEDEPATTDVDETDESRQKPESVTQMMEVETPPPSERSEPEGSSSGSAKRGGWWQRRFGI